MSLDLSSLDFSTISGEGEAQDLEIIRNAKDPHLLPPYAKFKNKLALKSPTLCTKMQGDIGTAAKDHQASGELRVEFDIEQGKHSIVPPYLNSSPYLTSCVRRHGTHCSFPVVGCVLCEQEMDLDHGGISKYCSYCSSLCSPSTCASRRSYSKDEEIPVTYCKKSIDESSATKSGTKSSPAKAPVYFRRRAASFPSTQNVKPWKNVSSCNNAAEAKCSRKISAKRRNFHAMGRSPDTAMELSDDEEVKNLAFNNQLSKIQRTMAGKENLKITYPSRNDPDAIEVLRSDLQYLAPREFLNDTIIDFHIKYIQHVVEFHEKMKKCHFFNSFFFKKLAMAMKICKFMPVFQSKRTRKIPDYFSKIRKWTKGINIFDKTYLIMPVHDSAHWSLAIVCFSKARMALRSLCPFILHLDSMVAGHSSEEVFRVVKLYLEKELQATGDLSIKLSESVQRRVEVPLQDNAWDCGVFVLFYVECFVSCAPTVFRPENLEKMFGEKWFDPKEASNLRPKIRITLQNLFRERSASGHGSSNPFD